MNTLQHFKQPAFLPQLAILCLFQFLITQPKAFLLSLLLSLPPSPSTPASFYLPSPPSRSISHPTGNTHIINKATRLARLANYSLENLCAAASVGGCVLVGWVVCYSAERNATGTASSNSKHMQQPQTTQTDSRLGTLSASQTAPKVKFRRL